MSCTPGLKACSQKCIKLFHTGGGKGKWLERVSREVVAGEEAAWRAQRSLRGSGFKGCAAAEAIRVTAALQSACKRKEEYIKQVDCCDFGSGAENGKEELKKMN